MNLHCPLLLAALCVVTVIGALSRPNILFLVSDDMRPELEIFLGPDFPAPVHPPRMHTPNINRLAGQSLLLKRAHVQQALCSPSRTSLLTGRRPDTTHVYDLSHYFRKVGGNFTTIPQFFKENGYLSVGMGKIFHPGRAASDFDDPISWSEPYYHAPNFQRYETAESWKAVPASESAQFPLPDQQIAQNAIDTLTRLAPQAKTGEQPFFVAAGFHKPHLPFVFPESYLNYYPKDTVKLPANPYVPKDFPPVAFNKCTGLLGYKDIRATNATMAMNTTLPDYKTLELRRAYYSAISYTDDMVGRVLGALEELGLANNTIVTFWGDHGWQLGEHTEWCKQDNFDLATHTIMTVRIPGRTDRGLVTEHLTEFTDLFPTLVEAAGYPAMPVCPPDSSQVALCTEGTSLMPLISQPNTTQWKQRVFMQYPRGNGNIMGYSMRTDRYRYTEWVGFHTKHYKPNWDRLVAAELYDHGSDPQENINLANDPGYKTIRQGLHKMLIQGWRGALV